MQHLQYNTIQQNPTQCNVNTTQSKKVQRSTILRIAQCNILHTGQYNTIQLKYNTTQSTKAIPMFHSIQVISPDDVIMLESLTNRVHDKYPI